MREGEFVVGLDGVVIDSVERLHQTLDASCVYKDCVFKMLRGTSGAASLYLGVRPGEQAAS